MLPPMKSGPTLLPTGARQRAALRKPSRTLALLRPRASSKPTASCASTVIGALQKETNQAFHRPLPRHALYRCFLQSNGRRFAKRQNLVAVSQVGEWGLALRGWQRRAFETWSAKRPDDALIVATPGAGKTRFAARVVHAALAGRDVARVIVVVPREHLKGQVARVFAQSGIQLDHAFANATRTLASD